jgi:hypothetical protein
MMVAVLPLMRTPETKRRYLGLVAHLTAVTLWVKCCRFLPHVPRQRRIVLSGLGCGLVRDVIGFELAATCAMSRWQPASSLSS